MREELLHFVWEHGLYNARDLKTTSGDRVAVQYPGELNNLSGPDFHEAKIRIGETLWAGSVEIHVKSSDWFKHNHEPDKAYGNVILHVVFEHDVVTDGFYEIPVMELKGRITRKTLEKYELLKESKNKIPCHSLIGDVSPLLIKSQWNKALEDRLSYKAAEIARNYKSSNGDPDVTFYRALLKAFGFKANNQAFEELAVRTPFYVVKKCAHIKGMLEALLLGQSGLMPLKPFDDYQKKLRSDYEFLKNKYALHAMSPAAWKTGGVRPGNSPVIRLAQLAALFEQNPYITSEVYKADVDQLVKVFEAQPGTYWDNRYSLKKTSSKKLVKKLTRKAIDNLLINTIAPFVYFVGLNRDRADLCEKSRKLLNHLKPEENSIVESWKSLGLHFASASETQAALHQKRFYCRKSRCLHCEIGKNIVE